jgi:predicted O-methyltransferase YrrM
MDKIALQDMIARAHDKDDRPEWLRKMVGRPASFKYYRTFVLLARELVPEFIVEIGTNQGTGALHFRHGSPKPRILTIDIHKSAKHELIAKHNIEQVVCESAQYATQIEDKSIDILFIDGGHTYAQLIADVTAWIPKMKEGGIVLLDDVRLAEYPIGIPTGMSEAWDEIEVEGDKFEVEGMHNCAGFGVILT